MNETKICVIGLGYVGLPLARLFSTKYKTIGFDMNQARHSKCQMNYSNLPLPMVLSVLPI